MVRYQAFFAQEELLMFNERLYLSGAVRGERSSVNADRDKIFYFPRVSGSYRFAAPIKGVTEVKLRAAYGESGNQPNFGERDLTFAQYGLIGGLAGFGWVAASMGTTYAFERKPLRLFMIDAGYHGVTYVVMGAILGVWS